MAQGLADWGEHAAAADLLAESCDMAPLWPPIHFQLGEYCRLAGREDEAEAALKKYLELDPEDHMGAKIKLALMGRIEAETAITETYVQTLFDQYAPRFDEVLVEKLNYHTPEHLAEMILNVAKDNHFDMALDLGCGTGLSIAPLRGNIKTAVGVDISSGMIEQAREKNLYDGLHVLSLEHYLAEHQYLNYDLVISSDVFIYLGDLAPVFEKIAGILRPGGLLAFSVQKSDTEPFILGQDHRFSHGFDYVRTSIAAAGLKILSHEERILREDAGADVHGYLFVCGK